MGRVGREMFGRRATTNKNLSREPTFVVPFEWFSAFSFAIKCDQSPIGRNGCFVHTIQPTKSR
jgi:hypothetical protein